MKPRGTGIYPWSLAWFSLLKWMAICTFHTFILCHISQNTCFCIFHNGEVSWFLISSIPGIVCLPYFPITLCKNMFKSKNVNCRKNKPIIFFSALLVFLYVKFIVKCSVVLIKTVLCIFIQQREQMWVWINWTNQRKRHGRPILILTAC